MTANDLERALQAMVRRRSFRSFMTEFHSGDRILVSHPEAVRRYGRLFVYGSPERGHRIFAGTSVTQVIDPPAATPAG
jgi:hypothetical protein